MSAGVNTWKHSPLEGAEYRSSPSPARPLADRGAIDSLVRQLFFSEKTPQRTRVLFAAIYPGTRIFTICERVGAELSELSGATVAIVEDHEFLESGKLRANGPRSGTSRKIWQASGLRLAERLWRIPSWLLPEVYAPEKTSGAALADLPFDYVLFASVLSHVNAPAFCSFCKEAVLVLTAGQTRRESAVRAMETLQQCNATVLGSVLDGRVFPVPESIYRRL